MQEVQTSSPSAWRRFWHVASKRAWAAYLCTLLIGLALLHWDAVHNTSADTDPLQTDRLYLRLAGIFAIAANFTIVGAVTFRLWRAAARQSKGLCPTCGYDVRASTGRCPECGAPLPARSEV